MDRQTAGRPFCFGKPFQKFDFLLDGKRTELLIFLVFLLPGLPKDALTYLVSFNPKIKPMYLFFLTTLGRTPATVLTVFMGKSLWEGNYILTIVLAGVIVLLAAAGIFIKRKVDKRAAQKHQLSDETADNKYWKGIIITPHNHLQDALRTCIRCTLHMKHRASRSPAAACR
ncbi:MAG: hypothetical protein ACLR1R_02120 [Ruminococcus callidus]